MNQLICIGVSVIAVVFIASAGHAQRVINAPPMVIPDFFDVNEGDVLTVGPGGVVGTGLTAHSGSIVKITGGTIGSFRALSGSDVEVIGGEFRLNGVEYTQDIVVSSGRALTGTLADGSTFTAGPFLQGVSLICTELPPLDQKPMVLTSPDDGRPSGLRAGQTLAVQSGGQLRDYFSVVTATLNVEDGVVGERLTGYEATIHVGGGEVGRFFRASNGSVVNLSGGSVGRNFSISGSTLNISGGTLGPNSNVFASEVNISGGTLDSGFRSLGDTVVTVSGGTLGDQFRIRPQLHVFDGTLGDYGSAGTFVNVYGGSIGRRLTVSGIMNVYGGTVGDDLLVSYNAVVNTFDGTMGDGIVIYPGATLNISGGSVGRSLIANRETEVNISGGTIGDAFNGRADSEINLLGTRFLLDGVVLENLEYGEEFAIHDRDKTLSGTLADGTFFSFELNSVKSNDADFFSSDAMLTVTLVVPEPASLVSLTFICSGLFSWRHAAA